MTLKQWLDLPHRFRWGGVGGDDCTTFCASWVAEALGADPAERLRGTYATQEEAHAILVAAGGLVPFMTSHLQPLGYERIDAPQDGDIGAVLAPVGSEGDFKEIGAVRFGPLWAVLGPHGVSARKLEHIAAWGLRA